MEKQAITPMALTCFAIFLLYQLAVVSEDSSAALQRTLEQLSRSTASLTEARAQLDRDDRLITQLLKGWDRTAPVLSKQVTVTSYTSRPEETDSTPYITACNTPVIVGGAAVSRDLFNLVGGCGKKVVLVGYGSLTINDKLNSRYKNAIDIWSGDLKAARLHGRQTAEMVWQ